ncbi:hypothetical protein GGH17_002814 [Coemansia sp. RSA 788]|nr:hypothetical protein GGH17_002814 [Coemansia sp. RSA 788]
MANDPRLSTAMYNPHAPQMQMQNARMGVPEGWAPPSMYAQDQSQYVPMHEMGSHSGRSTPAFPSDDQIIDAIRRILVNADLATTTKKVIRAQLVQEFGCDLAPKKDFISKIVDQMLIGGA